MPAKAKLFVTATSAAGALVLAACLAADPSFPEPARFLHCLVLALLASTFKIKLPRMQSTIAVNFVLFLIAVGQLSLTETLVIGAASTILQVLWRPKTKPKVVQVAFNASTTTISLALAFWATETFRGAGGKVPGLVVAAGLFFFVNSGLVSLVLALLNSQSPIAVWRNCHRWAFPYYMAGSVIAGLVTLYSDVVGWQQALAMLPLIYMLYTCYDSWMVEHRTEPQATAS